jgi:hypothetical protein
MSAGRRCGGGTPAWRVTGWADRNADWAMG